MNKAEIKTVTVDINDVLESPFNPRRITDDVLARLKKSIQQFGYVDPLIVNKQNMQVVGGNQRLRAMKELGYTNVSVVFVDLDDSKEKALNVALNKISGEWDFEKLTSLMTSLDEADLEFTGFGDSEIEMLLQSANGVADFQGSDGDGAEYPGEGRGESSDSGSADAPHSSNSNSEAFVVYLTFKTMEKAESWCKAHELSAQFREGKKTTMILMD